ncbi:MAG: electron transfer flavoprotein alpha subunit [Bacteroidota bacterium]
MVLVFAETTQGKFGKSALEAVAYGYRTAKAMDTVCTALVIGPAADAGALGTYGADRVLQVAAGELASFDGRTYAAIIAQFAQTEKAAVVVLSHTAIGKCLAGRLSIRLRAGLVSGAKSVPAAENGQWLVSKGVFSGKAIATLSVPTRTMVVSVAGNEVKPEVVGQPVSVQTVEPEYPAPQIRVLETKRLDGIVPLPEAEIVVSAGRGMKGPENWGIIEDLAAAFGATTACSRPVADADWRPHHEHVGQTGVAIRPNLYVAVGISGAIQHLAGVNQSKTIVVINKDPEAPFFKAADYGVVGDLFDVVPQLTEAVRKAKSE